MPYNPDMSTEARTGSSAMVGRFAKVKALDPLTSTAPPSPAQVTECSEKGIMLRVKRHVTVGTVVQLHLDGDFSLWKGFCCVPQHNSFHLGLEFVEAVSPDKGGLGSTLAGRGRYGSRSN